MTRKKKRACESDLGGELQARDRRTVDTSGVRRHKVVRRLGTINLRASEETGQFPTRYDEISQSCRKGIGYPRVNRNPRPIEYSGPSSLVASRYDSYESVARTACTYRCHVVGAQSRRCYVERSGNLVGQRRQRGGEGTRRDGTWQQEYEPRADPADIEYSQRFSNFRESRHRGRPRDRFFENRDSRPLLRSSCDSNLPRIYAARKRSQAITVVFEST